MIRRPRSQWTGFIAAAIAGGAIVASGQTRQDPARDANRRPVATDGARVAGIVHIDDADRAPLRGARVTIAPGLVALPMTTATDDNGRFVFTNVPPGNYTLVVMRAGFVTTYFGSRTPGRGPGVPIAVVEGRPVPDLAVAVVPGASIAGTVRSPLGQPVAGVLVQASNESVPMLGVAVPTPSGVTATATDDRGEYRLYGLAPGAYLISVRGDVRQFAAVVRPVTPEELRWAESVAGAAATGVAAADPPPAPASLMQAPVFFPASPDAAGAAPIAVSPGEERTGIDMVLPLAPTATVSGVVFGEDGAPAAGVVVQVESPRAQDAFEITIMAMQRSTRTDAFGAFAIQGVPPGEYRVTARLAEPPRAPAQPPSGMAGIAAMAMMGITGSSGGPAGWYTSEPVFVQGRDVEGVALRLTRVPAVTARVVFADAVPDPAPPSPAFMLMPVSAGATPADMANALRSSSLFVANDDGTFTARGALPGRYIVTTFDLARLAGQAMTGQMGTLPGDAWTMVSAVAGGRDLADEPVEITGGSSLDDLVLTFTNRPTGLSGTVIDRADRPTGAFPIVVFSTNRAHWRPGARRTLLVRPATNGTYRAAGLPPGEYYVAAVTEADDRSLGDPAFLEMLVPGAFTIALGPGEQKVQDLRLGGG